MPWEPGQSGNPKGRPPVSIDISALARKFGPRCIDVLNELLEDKDDPRTRYMAAQALLDRGFGKAPQLIDGLDSGGSLTMLHLVAARAVAEQMQVLLAAGVKPDSSNGNGHGNGKTNGHSNGNGHTIDGVAIDYTKPALE